MTVQTSTIYEKDIIMKSYEVLRKAFKPVGCKQVAAELKLSPSLIYQWSRGQDGKSAAVNPLDRVVQMLATTKGDGLLDWLCQQRGGRFVRPGDLPALVHRCLSHINEEVAAKLIAGSTEQSREVESWKLGSGRNSQRPTPSSSVRGSRESGGSRCRHRLPGGRCGFNTPTGF